MLLGGLAVHAEYRWLGDVNKDDVISMADVAQLTKILKDKDKTPITKLELMRLDVNQDGKLDEAENKKVWIPEAIIVDPGKDDGGFD